MLAGVQSDSDAVWRTISEEGGGDEGTGQTWHTAVIAIEARADGPWTAKAKGVSGATTFEFTPRPPSS